MKKPDNWNRAWRIWLSALEALLNQPSLASKEVINTTLIVQNQVKDKPSVAVEKRKPGLDSDPSDGAGGCKDGSAAVIQIALADALSLARQAGYVADSG